MSAPLPDSPTADRVPVYLLTGFLGSGKTTLLNAALRAPALSNTAVIVNEFGAIALDHHLIATGTDHIKLLDSGCLCCTLGDSLAETLADLHQRKLTGQVPAFERVIIETTGLADPAPLVGLLLGHALITDVYRLNGVITTVDGEHAAHQLPHQWEIAKQIAFADRLVITKTDRISAGELTELQRLLAALNPLARRFARSATDAAGEVFSPRSEPLLVPRFAPAKNGAHAIRCMGVYLKQSVSYAGLAAWSRLVTEHCGERVLRIKGLLRILDDESIRVIHGVRKVFYPWARLDRWPDADPRPRLICIARDLTQTEFLRLLPALCVEAGSSPWLSLQDLRELPDPTAAVL